MSRKRTEINPERAIRLKTLIDRENKTQAKFAKMLHMSQQNISRIVQKKQALTLETAEDIIKLFSDRPPEKQYRLQWLLGLDDYMTLEDMYREKQLQQLHDTDKLLRVMTDLVELSGFCVDEDIITTDGLSFVHYMSFSREDGAVTLPLADFREFGEEIRDYVEMRLKRMIEQCQKRRDQ